MKTLFLLILVAAISPTVAQTVSSVSPTNIVSLDLSPESAAKFEKDYQLYLRAVGKVNGGQAVESLSPEERRVYNEMDETIENYWDILGAGCSWYCGGGPLSVTASSRLSPQGSNRYESTNAHDLSYRTAWVEGAPGYGIGEYLTYTFAGSSPRITDIIVVNGYVKSEQTYLDNSRVKKLRLSLDGKPLAILELTDQRSAQVFTFQPIGNPNRSDFAALKLQPQWVLTFEILEVYKGRKYDDVAITEIYFDGLDVH